jgi:hypothetical protein
MLSDFPSMVCAIFAAYLLFRALDRNGVDDGVLCGLVLGFLVLLKPANGPLLVVGVLVLAVAFRFRALIAASVSVIPALIALSVWKKTGTGAIGALPASPPGGGGGSTGGGGGSTGGGGGGSTGGGGGGSTLPGSRPAPAPGRLEQLYHRALNGFHHYVDFNWHHLGGNVHDLREVFWSLRLLEFFLVAGTIALVVRSRWKGVLVVGWFVGFGVIKATNVDASVTSTSVYRYLLPAWPAWVLLVAAVVLLWPGGAPAQARRRAEDGVRRQKVGRPPRGVLVAVALLLAAGPLVLSVAASPIAPKTIAQQDYTGSPIGVVDFHLIARRVDQTTVRLTWDAVRTAHARYSYRIFKDTTDGCTIHADEAPVCLYSGTAIAESNVPAYVDPNAAGKAVYRVALAAGWSLEQTNSDLLLLSGPITVPAR